MVAFEPDPQAWEELNRTKREQDHILPYAVAGISGRRTFHLTRKPACSSLLEPNHELLRLFPNAERLEVVNCAEIEVVTLDDLATKGRLAEVDFAKLDAQGVELEILQGGAAFLRNQLVCLQVEVEFIPIYRNQPLFAAVDAFVRNELHLDLYDLEQTRWKTKAALPLGKSKGQLAHGDALYLRQPDECISWCKTLPPKTAFAKFNSACLAGLAYGLIGYSLALIQGASTQNLFPKDVLSSWELLITEVGHQKRFPLFFSARIAALFNGLAQFFSPPETGRAATTRLGLR